MNVKTALIFCWIGLLPTGPLSGESIRFAVLGDSRIAEQGRPENDEFFAQLVEKVLEVDPPVKFVVFTGDLVYGTADDQSTAEKFRLWRKIAAPWYQSEMIGSKVYVVPGNHDLVNKLTYARLWQEGFPNMPDNGPEYDRKLTYSFDFGPCHLAVVNTSIPIDELNHQVDLDWLARDLAASDKPIKFVFGHEPAYAFIGTTSKSLDIKPEQRDRFWQVLVDNGVQAYFCGHEHLYNHWIKDGVHQIITGGAGAPALLYHFIVVDADEKDATMTVYRISGELHDRFKLSDTESVPNEDRSDPERSLVDIVLPCSSAFGCIAAVGALGFFALSRFGNRKRDE